MLTKIKLKLSLQILVLRLLPSSSMDANCKRKKFSPVLGFEPGSGENCFP